MSKIPTAKEYLKSEAGQGNNLTEFSPTEMFTDNDIYYHMREFAKMHVRAALEAASQVHLSGEIDQQAFDKMGEEILSEKALKYNRKQIINAYPRNLIQ